MNRIANISQFEALMNRSSNPIACNSVFNDGGTWSSDGWHSINEVPAVDPDDGWNDMRRENPELFQECGMVSPDDGKNWLRLANPGRFKAEELLRQLKELEKKRDEYKQEKRKQDAQEDIDKKINELLGYMVRGDVPYNEDEAKPYLEKLQKMEKEEESKHQIEDDLGVEEDGEWKN